MRDCTVAVEPADLPRSVFDRTYRDRDEPVVIRNATSQTGARFRELTTLRRLAADWGEQVVTLSSANAFSYGRTKMRLDAYLDEMEAARWTGDAGQSADRTFYFFGEHGSELQPLLTQYRMPRYAQQDAACALTSRAPPAPEPALSFGAAADGSGVPFHFHNDGFSEVMHGAKRWFLYRREPPEFDANATSSQWLRRVYPTLPAHALPLECVIWPGDLLYFPKGWWHAIVNVGNTVFMSTFL